MTSTSPIIPPALQPGSRIAIVSPAGRARIPDVESAVRLLTARGFQPEVMPHALGFSGSFSATLTDRLADMTNALLDPQIKAIICSRGGYGAVHLLEHLDRLPLRSNPKWLIGFSDITALHGLFSAHGIASIHGPMAKHISAQDGDNPDFHHLLDILSGHPVEYHLEPHPFNRPGTANAPLSGGNLAVASSLIGTRFDTLRPGTILFIEDIAEPIYKVQRILYQLRLSGVLDSLAGLLVGQFTNYLPDVNHPDMETMIRDMVDDYTYPVAFNIPAGHGGRALPLILGSATRLYVGSQVTLYQNWK